MVVIQEKSNDQVVVTIPRRVANLVDIEDGQKAEWKAKSAKRLVLNLDP